MKITESNLRNIIEKVLREDAWMPDWAAPWNEEPPRDPSYDHIERKFNTASFITALLDYYSDSVADPNDLSKLPQEIIFFAEYEYDEGFDGEDTYMENENVTSVKLLFNINGKEVNFNDFIQQNQQSFSQNSILAFNEISEIINEMPSNLNNSSDIEDLLRDIQGGMNNGPMKITESQIVKLVTEEMTKSDVLDIVKKDRDFEKRIKDITTDVITDLFRILFQHQGIFKNLRH